MDSMGASGASSTRSEGGSGCRQHRGKQMATPHDDITMHHCTTAVAQICCPLEKAVREASAWSEHGCMCASNISQTRRTTGPPRSSNSRSESMQSSCVMSRLVSCVIWLRLRGSGAVTQSRSPRCCRRCSAVMPAGTLHVCGHGSDALKSKLVRRVHLQQCMLDAACPHQEARYGVGGGCVIPEVWAMRRCNSTRVDGGSPQQAAGERILR